MSDKIPLAKPYLGDEEVNAVCEVIKSGQLSLGPKLIEFEAMFAEIIGTRYAIAVSSGTSGLHLCIKALGIKPGDEVITSSFSFVASSNPVIFEGATPVFADIDPKTYNIDPRKIEEAITRKTKAIIVVHLFGQSCNMEEIMKIAQEKDIAVIEDSCEALGATYRSRKVGSFGKAAVFAFYANKQITTGEGGIILTDDDNFAKHCTSLRNQGRSDCGEWLNHVWIGYNYRLDEMSCAMGIEQLKKLDFILKKRKEIAGKYNKKLKNIEGLILPYVDSSGDSSWWVYYLQVADTIDRDKVLKYLNVNGVSARACFYPPIHLQPVYKKLFKFKSNKLPITEKISKQGFIIPFFVELTDEQIEKVSDTVAEAVRRSVE